jgi:predicted DNA-binding protein (UPF0251 family)/predicted Fe-Mo cluster-binding NifX family protein
MRRRCRRYLDFRFNRRYFKPRGVPLAHLQEVRVTDEELETLRLRYIEGLKQEDAARKMKISQSQYQRDLSNVLERITKALIEGHAIHVENVNKLSNSKKMKILFPMDSKNKSDGLSDVFGRSKYFATYNTDEEKLEFKDNPGVSQARGAGVTAGQFAIDNGVNKVVLKQIGPNAENVLKQGGIEVQVEESDKSLDDIIKSL